MEKGFEQTRGFGGKNGESGDGGKVLIRFVHRDKFNFTRQSPLAG